MQTDIFPLRIWWGWWSEWKKAKHSDPVVVHENVTSFQGNATEMIHMCLDRNWWSVTTVGRNDSDQVIPKTGSFLSLSWKTHNMDTPIHSHYARVCCLRLCWSQRTLYGFVNSSMLIFVASVYFVMSINSRPLNRMIVFILGHFNFIR